MSFKNKFSNLGHPNRIWTVSAIHGELDQLVSIHKSIYDKFAAGDRLVYTGNYFASRYAKPAETLDELLYFRRSLMARPGVQAEDIVYLRGVQEEIWSKLLQLQFAPSAVQVAEWIAGKYPELDILLQAYGSSLGEVRRIAREGVISQTRWTSALKARIRSQPGHEKFFSVLRRAAFTEQRLANDNEDRNILFVHSGLDPSLPLAAQEDRFWWASRDFNEMGAYAPFRAVIRGCDPERQGVHLGTARLTIDGGCGHGGKLICAQLSASGDILGILAA